MSYNRYQANQVGQSPEDYDGSEVGIVRGRSRSRHRWNPCIPGNPEYNEVMCQIYNERKRQRALEQGTVMGQGYDPCDMADPYFDENECAYYGGTPYDSSNPYGTSPSSPIPMDWSFCDSLVQVLIYPPPPAAKFSNAQAEQQWRKQMESYYNLLNNYVEKKTLVAPNGNFSIPFRLVQVSNTGDPYQDFYTNETGQYLVFADTNSPEWINAGLDQYCPSYVGLPTGQCQDIPGYQCQMSGESIIMGEDYVLMGASKVVKALARKAAYSPKTLPKGKVVWRKMNTAEKARQLNRYRAGGTSRAPQNKVPLSPQAKATLVSRLKNIQAKASMYPYVTSSKGRLKASAVRRRHK